MSIYSTYVSVIREKKHFFKKLIFVITSKINTTPESIFCYMKRIILCNFSFSVIRDNVDPLHQ